MRGRAMAVGIAGSSGAAAVMLLSIVGTVAQSPDASPAASVGVGSPAPSAASCPSPSPTGSPASPTSSAQGPGSPGPSPSGGATSCPTAGDSASPAASEASVIVRDFEFVPETVTVATGSTVSWTNEGPSGHTVTADDGSFDSGVLLPGETFELTFDLSGTYAYHCVPHPNMTGTVIVR